ncbi:aspartyl-phosphate phosphatase Spo0E family protein [Caenibacillus caldisaponilyticus]|uniref:aspartyl-phosphate phosphatase Spo0E family protein n=1 Tax=Caenibacillus caldisaponilyticus TaxID=1674942 RepID=UPI00098851AA|nr:aspartyl-phosphate phosphatase Spo0E family protein [Caenibacillus caldisaponilyticus]
MLNLESISEADLMRFIAKKRDEMVKVAAVRGIKNGETVRQSRELDTLIVLYQKRFVGH